MPTYYLIVFIAACALFVCSAVLEKVFRRSVRKENEKLENDEPVSKATADEATAGEENANAVTADKGSGNKETANVSSRSRTLKMVFSLLACFFAAAAFVVLILGGADHMTQIAAAAIMLFTVLV